MTRAELLKKIDEGWRPSVSPAEELARLREHIPALFDAIREQFLALEPVLKVVWPGIVGHLERVIAREAELSRVVPGAVEVGNAS